MSTLVYLDTCSLLKRYLPEPGSDELEQRLQAVGMQLMLSELTEVEMLSAFRRRERQGLIDRTFANAAYDYFLDDVAQDQFAMIRMDKACLRRATQLFSELSAPLATLDSLHLASALVHGADMFFTHDAQLSRAALEAGLQVWPG